MLAALHVPDEQHVDPVHPWPPHCPYKAAQPLAGGVGEVAGADEVVPPPLFPPADDPTVIVDEPVLKYCLMKNIVSQVPGLEKYLIMRLQAVS